MYIYIYTHIYIYIHIYIHTYIYIYTRDEAWPGRCKEIIAGFAMQARRLANCFFFANRIVGEPSAAGKLDTWPDRPGPMVS